MLSATETTNDELYAIGKKILGKRFLAVLPADYAMYNLKSKNTCCILNTDDSKNQGIHWIGIIRLNNDITWFYDSYRRPFITLSKHWIEKPWQQIINKPEQSIVSTNCGQLTLSMLCTVFKYGIDAFDVV